MIPRSLCPRILRTNAVDLRFSPSGQRARQLSPCQDLKHGLAEFIMKSLRLIRSLDALRQAQDEVALVDALGDLPLW